MYDSTILKARQLGANLYTAVGTIIKIHAVAPTTFGWRTNSLTKSRMLSSMREAVESGLIELNDQDLINEFKSFTVNELLDKPVDIRLISSATRHFDLLIAACICWEMRNHARKAKPIDDFDVNVWKNQESNPAI